jgi:hypothetical protein
MAVFPEGKGLLDFGFSILNFRFFEIVRFRGDGAIFDCFEIGDCAIYNLGLLPIFIAF